MESTQRSHRLHLFTVHLWQDSRESAQSTWYGRITNTSTGAKAHFRRWQELEHLVPRLIDDADGDGEDIDAAVFKGSVFDRGVEPTVPGTIGQILRGTDTLDGGQIHDD